jgi:hypothetical protein
MQYQQCPRHPTTKIVQQIVAFAYMVHKNGMGKAKSSWGQINTPIHTA